MRAFCLSTLFILIISSGESRPITRYKKFVVTPAFNNVEGLPSCDLMLLEIIDYNDENVNRKHTKKSPETAEPTREEIANNK